MTSGLPEVKKTKFKELDEKTIYKEMKKTSSNVVFFTVKKKGFYTIIPYKPKKAFSFYADKGKSKKTKPLKEFEEAIQKFDKHYHQLPKKAKGKLPKFFSGGLLGFFGFNAYLLEQNQASKSLGQFQKKKPLAVFFEVENFILLDHSSKKALLVSNPLQDSSGKARQKIKEMQEIIEKAKMHSKQLKAKTQTNKAFRARADQLAKKIRFAKKLVESGKISQVNISLETKVKNLPPLVSIYQVFLNKHPTAYVFLFETKECGFVGASPETLFESRKGNATVKPISGSFPRGTTATEDRALGKKLLEDRKETREHSQIVSAVVADLKKVCKKNTVRVLGKKQLLKMGYVQHLQSKVAGEIRKDKSIVSAFFANFPPIAITGIPRKKAIKVIKRIEETPRFLYGGGIGFFSANKECDFGILIRCFQKVGKNTFKVRVGSKISKGSKTKLEAAEIVSKTESLVEIASKK